MTARISLIPGKARGHRPRLQFAFPEPFFPGLTHFYRMRSLPVWIKIPSTKTPRVRRMYAFRRTFDLLSVSFLWSGLGTGDGSNRRHGSRCERSRHTGRRDHGDANRTGAVRATVSNEEGRYLFADLALG